MTEQLIIWTLDWVPELVSGFVRDLRLRWAAEVAGLAFEVNQPSAIKPYDASMNVFPRREQN